MDYPSTVIANLKMKITKKKKSEKKKVESELPSVSRQIRHWICSEGPASRSISEGSERGIGGTRGEVSEWSAIEIQKELGGG